MVSQKEITEELRGECNGCKRDMLADRIEAEGIAPKPYVPMTDEQVGTLSVFDGLHHVETPILAEYIRHIESAVIKRLGLEIKLESL